MSAIKPDEHKDRLRVAVVGHSLCHSRQYMFLNHIQYSPWLYNYTDILQIYPRQWGNITREGGYSTIGSSMVDFVFGSDAVEKIVEYKPDLLHVMQEFYCNSTLQMSKLISERLPKTALCVFIWENIKENAEVYAKFSELIKRADFVVCGSGDARRLVEPYLRDDVRTDVFPQVGVDCSLFRPMPEVKKDYDYIFVGRQNEQKGWKVIEKAITPLNRVLKLTGTRYEDMVQYYNRAKVHLSPVIDTPYWREQWCSFSNAEALACGLHVVTSNSASIFEYLQGVPGVYFVKQNDMEDLRVTAEDALSAYNREGVNKMGRSFVYNHLSTEKIAQRTLEAWKSACQAIR